MRKFKEEQVQSINRFFMLYQTGITGEKIIRYFENFGLKVLTNKDTTRELVSKYGNILFQENVNNVKFSAIVYSDTYYLLVDYAPNEILFESNAKLPANNFFVIIFVIISVLIFWLYISTMKSIKPITELRKAVRQFANGNLDVQYFNDKQDEIGELSQEFNKAVRMIQNLLSSRTLFLRTIMHELKTPIGKGRIVAEMVEEDLQRNRLIKIFKRLDILINEFAKVEQIATKNYSMNKSVHGIHEIFDMAFNILMLEPEQFNKKVKIALGKRHFMVNVDLELMALVFKNLIDNALKYGSNHAVKVSLKKNILTFTNTGEPLEKPIEECRQAFISSTKDDKRDGGMGLGLYIVDSILSMHDLKLEYEYKDGSHCFFINLIRA